MLERLLKNELAQELQNCPANKAQIMALVTILQQAKCFVGIEIIKSAILTNDPDIVRNALTIVSKDPKTLQELGEIALDCILPEEKRPFIIPILEVVLCVPKLWQYVTLTQNPFLLQEIGDFYRNLPDIKALTVQYRSYLQPPPLYRPPRHATYKHVRS